MSCQITSFCNLGRFATDSDLDTSTSQTLTIKLLGGEAGGAIIGTAGNDAILGTSGGEAIHGGLGNDH